MRERHFDWLRHFVYPRKYECVHECGMNASMNVYECVCESVSEWNECDMRMYESVCVWYECVYECVRMCVRGICKCVTCRPVAISL